ncbi:MAG: RNA methyltransferase [Prevotellaceae bacterium]|nr:RNA methyltransferase [Prevotellaceae bacterium]
MQENTISTAHNPKIKKLLALQQKAAERRKNGVFVVEGQRELQHCINAGLEIDSIFFCPEILGNNEDVLETLFQTARCYAVTAGVYNKIAYRGGTEGIIAEVKQKRLLLNDLQLKENPLLIILESVEKPGNLGAVLRSADAAGADAVIVCDPLTDIYNPNLIRSSIGAVFTVPCVACSTEECITFLKTKGIQILTAQLQDSNIYYDTDMTCSTAIVMGTEATGLTDAWRQAATRHIRIPMLGQLDSLNVSVSAAILMFEAVRQRQL